jgi:hypothetical protein
LLSVVTDSLEGCGSSGQAIFLDSGIVDAATEGVDLFLKPQHSPKLAGVLGDLLLERLLHGPETLELPLNPPVLVRLVGDCCL